MKFRAERLDQTVVLEVAGELDADGSAELEERFLFEQQEGAVHFVIALRELSGVSGPGLRVLLGFARALPRSGGSVVLCELDRRVEEALRVSGLDRSFDIAPDRAAALARSRERQVAGTHERGVAIAAGDENQAKIAFAIELLRRG
jgi:anti-anti-sigma factor